MRDLNRKEPDPIDARAFLFPLPAPLPVKDGQTVVQHDLELKATPDLHGMRTSVRFHQTTMRGSADALLISRLMEFAQQQLKGEDDPDIEPPDLRQEVDLTIAEIIVPVTEEDEDDPLDLAIGAVRQVQHAVMLATQRVLPPLTRQRLPLFVPMYGLRTNDEGTVDWDGPTLLIANDTRAIDRFHPSLSDPIDLEQLQPALEQMSTGGPFMLATDMRSEARLHLQHHGDYRAAVMSLAAAYEVLLDALLMSLLWEEGKDPAIATSIFGINGMKHTKRVVTEYHPRLKGDWTRGGGPVGKYLEKVVNLRQRIMHTGYSPSEDEASAAQQAGFELEEHISSRLRSPAIQKQYPRTAVMYCGASNLERDGDLYRRARDLLTNQSEGTWISQHERWADWTSRFGNHSPPTPGTRPDDLVVLLHVTQAERSVIVLDVGARAAASPKSPDDWLPSDSKVLRTLEEVVANMRMSFEYDDEWRRIRLDIDPDPSLVQQLTWQRDYELLFEHDHRLPDLRDNGPHLLPHQMRAAA